jgi:hypothetical protein
MRPSVTDRYGDWTFADADRTPTHRGWLRGTVYRVTFTDGSRAKETIPYDLVDAIRFFDPFQKCNP